MEIRRYLPDVDRWASVELADDDWSKVWLQLRAGGPIEIPRSACEVDTSQGPFPDFISFGLSAPILSERAWQVLEKLCPSLEPHTVDVPSADRPYFILRIPTVPLLDEEAATIRHRLAGDVFVDRYAFKPIPADTPAIFYVPEMRFKDILVTQEFIDCINEHKLTGLIFPKLLMADDQ